MPIRAAAVLAQVGFPVEIRLERLVGISQGHGWPIASCVSSFAFHWMVDLQLSDVDPVVPEDYVELHQPVHLRRLGLC